MKSILLACAMLFAAVSHLRAAPADTVDLSVADADGTSANGIQLNPGRTLIDGASFYITPGTAIQPAGSIAIHIPSSWSQPQAYSSMNSGYVNVFSTSAATLSVMTTGYIIVVQVTGAPVNPGEVVQVTYDQPWIQWNVQDDVLIPVRAHHTAASAAVEVLQGGTAPLSVDVIAGPPANLTFDTRGLVVEKGNISRTPVKIRLLDSAWVTTKATATVTIDLKGLVYDQNTYNYVPDPTALFYTSTNTATPVTQLSVLSGTSGAEFYYLTSTTSANTIIRITGSFSTMSSDMWASVISGGITNARIHKGDYTANSSIVLNVNETAYIDFAFDNANLGWQVLISTSADHAMPVWTYWGWGIPARGQVSWNGFMSYYDSVLGYWRNERAPNGTYYVRIQTGGGGICDDTLKLTLQSLDISGTVSDGSGNRLPGVNVNCYGPSCAYTVTDSTGRYVLAGLVAGSYNLNFSKAGYSWQGINGVNAGDKRDVVMKQPLYVRINAHRGGSTDTVNAERWGNIQLIARDTTAMSYWGSIHFAVDVSTSDNGMWASDSATPRYEIDNSLGMSWDGGKWSTLEVLPGNYTLRAEMPGYDTVERSFSVTASTFVADIVFAPRTTVTGAVKLETPSAESGGTWVSVEAVPAGSRNGTAWAGTFIPTGSSTGTYVVYGLASGDYTLRVSAQGYGRGSTTLAIAPGAMLVEVSTVTLNQAGGISGTVTIDGDTTDPALNNALPGESFPVNLNAWSPDSYGYGWTQVFLNKNPMSASTSFTMRGLEDGTYWVSSWLNGFELQDAIGGNGVRVVVSGGNGTVNLKFKRYSARVRCAFTVPVNPGTGTPDYDNLKISLSGMNVNAENVTMASILTRATTSYGISFDTHTGVMTSPPLVTGFFQVRGEYTGTGLTASKQVMTVNGQTSQLSMDLTADTYRIRGKVAVSAANPPQGYTDLAVLVATASYNNMSWDTMLGISTSTFRVRAVDYDKQINGISGTAGTAIPARSGFIREDGTFEIQGLVPGMYLLQIAALELDGNNNNGKETAQTEKLVYVNGDMNDIALEVSKGYAIRGQVKLPAGEISSRYFDISIYKPLARDKQFVGYGRAQLNGADSGDYEVRGLAPGNYILTVNDWGYTDSATGEWKPRQYAGSSINVKVEAADLNGQNIQLSKGGKILFKLRDADSGTIITWKNKDKFLPASFSVSGEAHPWVEGGWISMNSGSVTEGDSDGGSFAIPYLPEASYDLTFGKSTKDNSSSSTAGSSTGNQATYATKVISGIKVRTGQTVDIGTVDIRQGLTVSGTVTGKNGAPLPNIPVIAVPSLSTEWSALLNSFTDANGKYSIAGLDGDYPYYDVIACPRLDSRYLNGTYFFFGQGGVAYGEKTRAMIRIKDGAAVNFALDEAKGSVHGTITTVDGGPLQFMEDASIPKAVVLMQKENTVPRNNPIGDIEQQTGYDGSFTIESLSPGTYNLTVLSGGYLSASRTVTVENTGVDLGTLTLQRGARVSGSVTGVDGKHPSNSEVSVVVAANEDFSQIVMGTLKKAGDMTVTGYELAGFQPGTSYNIMFFGESGTEAIPALDNFSVPFSTYVKTDLNLVYKIAEPYLFSRVARDGTRYTVYFDLSGALRKAVPADELDVALNPAQTIVTVVAGRAQGLEYPYMSPDRKKIVCVYTAAAGETGFALRMHAFANAINPATGTEFEVDEQFQYYTGIAARNRTKVSNLKGGKITLDGDPSFIQFVPGTFEVGGSTSSVYVDFSRADNAGDFVAASSGRGAPALTIPRAAQAYPGRLYTAMKAAQSAGVSAFSAFYDVMLPQGVTRTLKKDATLTLQYAGSVDPTTLNIYYYDETNNVYLLENRSRVVDADAGTISVGVNHASVFVILQANAAVIQGSTYDGPVFVYNFPNPFNLDTRTVALTHPTQSRTITGTMLHYGLPTSAGGEVEIRIYNVAGELVRTINDGTKAGGYHYYTEWDGTNDDGKKVASGVYIARFTVDGKNEKFFKMAVIK
jgi:hypothetical protein